MALWYAREKMKHIRIGFQYYLFGPKKLVKNMAGNDLEWVTIKDKQTSHEDIISVCPEMFEKLHPKSMRLEPGEGPYKLKPLERA